MMAAMPADAMASMSPDMMAAMPADCDGEYDARYDGCDAS